VLDAAAELYANHLLADDVPLWPTWPGGVSRASCSVASGSVMPQGTNSCDISAGGACRSTPRDEPGCCELTAASIWPGVSSFPKSVLVG
jgi:hypothetical protein